MTAPPPQYPSYSRNTAYGHAVQINGSIHGPVHLPDGSNIDPCLRDLRITDPREDKDRIEASKDRLLRDCYAWILESPDFRRWMDHDDTQLLWIKGDPGKGKTMMMIALVEELSERFKAEPRSGILSPMLAKLKGKTRSGILSYFFCQSTDSRLNNSISVLKGLIYLLVIQKRGLIRHVQKRYDDAGGSIFEGPNALYALRATLLDILNDSTLPRTYLLVDALDECVVDLRQLLDIVTGNNFETRSKVKWLVASRNRPDIQEHLRSNGHRIKISLELNATHVSQAVTTFINYKVRELATRKKYDTKLQKEVKNQLCEKAEATFLWVALACKRLCDEEVPLWKTRSVLKDLPPGLKPLYGLMMDQILRRGDAEDVELCQQILRAVTVTYRPLLLQELAATAGLPEALFDSISSLHDLVDRCGSFLTVREGAIYFIHQSAKDYLATGNGRRIFFSSEAEEHGKIMHRSLDLMANTLRKDICDLKKPGALAREAEQNVSNGLLPRIGYACCYWVNHLGDYLVDSSSAQILLDGGKVHKFLQKHLLHWIEVLSLLRTMPEGVLMTKHLESVVEVWSPSIVRQQELTYCI
jgi:NACHT domain